MIPGTSTALFPEFSLQSLQKAKKSGLKYLEYGIGKSFMSVSEDECRERFGSAKEVIRASGMKVWSCHLPFGRDIDISMLDKDGRKKAVEDLSKLIRASRVLKPKYLVLHPSYEPIPDGEREARMLASMESIDKLRKVAAEAGVVLCIENLPRTCLGKNSEEILRLVERFPDVGVCFDVNHLLEEGQVEFARNVGERIKTLHISDYDKVNERHWIPGQGITPWGDLYNAIVSAGYKGVWMYETTNDRKIPKGRASVEQVMDSYVMILAEAGK